LADLAGTFAARSMMKLAAFQWRKLAEKAAERQKFSGLSISESMRPH
jgi:hypothetical protein